MKNIVLISHFKHSGDWVIDYLHKRNVHRIAYIMNARWPKVLRDVNYIFSDKLQFEKSGFEVDYVDLMATNDLKARLKSSDAIYVTGGNTFTLLNDIRRSGFDKMILDLLNQGMIYIGESAGSYVSCPSIEMAHWKHQDADIIGLGDLTALNLVPYLLTVHYKEENEALISEKIKESGFETKILADNQLILIENDKEELISL